MDFSSLFGGSGGGSLGAGGGGAPAIGGAGKGASGAGSIFSGIYNSDGTSLSPLVVGGVIVGALALFVVVFLFLRK